MTAIDTTVSLTTAQLAGLRAAGVTAVSRYIAPQAWKRITPAEYQRILAGGLQVSLNWESGAEDLRTITSSASVGYAREAVAQAQACGYPRGAVILNSADWDVHSGDWPQVAANLRAIRPVYQAAGYGLGLYAPWDALAWAKRDGLVDVYWQAGMSTAWSAGRNAAAWPGAHLRQRRSTVLAGVDCDINDVLIPAFGQAGADGPHLTSGVDVDLNTIVPGTNGPDGSPARSVGLVLLDLHKSVAPGGYHGWQTAALDGVTALLAGQAASQKREEATLAALTALSTGGTSVDTAAIAAHIDQVAAGESASVAALVAQVADLTHKLAAAEQAAAAVLAQ